MMVDEVEEFRRILAIRFWQVFEYGSPDVPHRMATMVVNVMRQEGYTLRKGKGEMEKTWQIREAELRKEIYDQIMSNSELIEVAQRATDSHFVANFVRFECASIALHGKGEEI